MSFEFLDKYRGKRICVAVSGGVDSVCLLHYIWENAEKFSVVLSALTCEHGIRGETSVRDVEFVQRFCAVRDIPLSVFRRNVPAYAKQSGRGWEEEGRRFRYECYEKILTENKADFVATAHHLDDLAETALFRLIRGTSLSGVAAIREYGGIIRPFLNVSRAEIEAYAEENGLAFVEDETNAETKYSRNALRRNVMPELEKVVSGAGRHLAEFARRAGEDDACLCALARERIRKVGEDYYIPVSLPRPLFLRAAVMVASSLVRFTDYTEGTLREAEKLLALQSGKTACLGCGVEAAREGAEIAIYLPRKPFADTIPFARGVHVLGAYTAVVGDAGKLFADYDKFPDGCVLRTRREGDAFTPYGGCGKTLKAFLTDKKIPARKGRELPLIAKEHEVYAVFGVEVSDFVKTDASTKHIVRLELNEYV